jgi:aspartyl-tRNA(Asn)/glutamyl-tRNA(Gln) amidotransferase subunit B
VIQAGFETVIGLEVHAQMLTSTKLFSPMTALFGGEPNSRVNEICAGMPGVLPVLNRAVVTCAIRAGLALDCSIRKNSRFARKNYFYPDLPKGYQISQFEQPICEHGKLSFLVDGEEVTCGITRIHMEEDAGKSIHVPGANVSHIDLNRAGVPLIEIVSEPDLRSPDQAVAYMKELRNILMTIGVCDGNMEEGSFRCDGNISIRRMGETALGTKIEIKNVNSFKFLKDALTYEMRRQVACLEAGEPLVQETRLWQTDHKRTVSMRTKEGSEDYRYFPDPDLPPLTVSDEWIDAVRSQLPELPAARRRRFLSEYQLPAYNADVLTGSAQLSSYFDAAAAGHPNPIAVSNWVMTQVSGSVSHPGELAQLAVRPEHIGELVTLIDEGLISGTIAKKVFAIGLQSGEAPGVIVDRENLRVVRDAGALAAIIDQVISDNPAQVEQFRGGKTKVKGFFVGQVMRATKGQADPKLVDQMLDEKLSG